MRSNADYWRVTLSFCLMLVVVLACYDSVSAQVTPSSPISAYLFDEAGGTTAGDSFSSNDGTLFSENIALPAWKTWSAADPTPETPFGYEGNSSLFFGEAGHNWVDLGDPANLDFDPENDVFTLSAWISSESGGGIVGKAAFTNNERQFYLWDDGSDSINMYAGGVYSNYRENDPNRKASGAPEWDHVAMVVESSTVAKIYVNGILGATIDPGTATLPGTNIYIGARHASDPLDNTQADFFFEGKIDEVAFWDTALSQENITWLQTNSLSTLVPEPSSFGLIGFCVFAITLRSVRRQRANHLSDGCTLLKSAEVDLVAGRRLCCH